MMSRSTRRSKPVTLPPLTLSDNDLAVFNFESGPEACLNDKHIDHFLYLVQEEGTFRPQSTLFVQNPQWINAINREDPYLQILYKRSYGAAFTDTNRIGHWIAVHYNGKDLLIYDSLNCTILGRDLDVYFRKLFPKDCPQPIFCPVQGQNNGIDCGLFAMAFAASIIHGQDPSKELYDVSKMRQHAREILVSNRISLFPVVNDSPLSMSFSYADVLKTNRKNIENKIETLTIHDNSEEEPAMKRARGRAPKNSKRVEITISQEKQKEEPTFKRPKGRPKKKTNIRNTESPIIKAEKEKEEIEEIIIVEEIKSVSEPENDFQIVESEVGDDVTVKVSKRPRGRPPKRRKNIRKTGNCQVKNEETSVSESESSDVSSVTEFNEFDISEIELEPRIKAESEVSNDHLSILQNEKISKRPRGRPPKRRKNITKTENCEVKNEETSVSESEKSEISNLSEFDLNEVELEPRIKAESEVLNNHLSILKNEKISKRPRGRPPKRRKNITKTENCEVKNEEMSVSESEKSEASSISELNEASDELTIQQEKRERRLQQMRDYARRKRKQETEEERERRLEKDRERRRIRKQNETEEERKNRLKEKRNYDINQIESETQEEREIRLEMKKHYDQEKRQIEKCHVQKGYEPLARKPVTASDVEEHYLGPMNVECEFCKALHFAAELKSDDMFSNCCHRGKVETPPPTDYPKELYELLTGNISQDGNETPDPNSITKDDHKNFLNNIRSYNSAFAFLSLNAPGLDPPKGKGPYVFRIHGSIYHAVGPLHPPNGIRQSYGQLYILDTDEALKNRMDQASNKDCTEKIMRKIDSILREINPFVEAFQNMAQVEKRQIEEAKLKKEEPKKVFMKMIKQKPVTLNEKRYNEPTCSEIAVVFEGVDGAPPDNLDFLIWPRDKQPYNIRNTSPYSDPMRYPIFFPQGRFGWYPGLSQKGKQDKNLTALQYYANQLAVRQEFNPVLNAGKLTQEYVVGAWVKIEANRLSFIRKKQQDQLRSDLYSGLMDHINNKCDQEGTKPGKIVILPSTHMGSPRAVQQQYQDSMAIVQKFGKPDLFLTMTCNPKWKEITENLAPGQTASDRPDLIARVFKLKMEEMINDIVVKQYFGPVTAYLYVVEFQKRGLPHVHMLITLKNKIRTKEEIDEIVCAELPDKDKEPELYEIVKTCMMHGPCGGDNKNAPCMSDGKCQKKFPKPFQNETVENVNGYPVYRRRDDGRFIWRKVGGQLKKLDNRYVVPYNKCLSLKYRCHINVEICSSIKSVKYLCKYVYKGHDCAMINVTNIADADPDDKDKEKKKLDWNEIKLFIDARYVCAPEAMHRILEFKMHGRSHAIYRLAVHLKDQQTVVFKNGEIQKAIENARETTLTAWFKLNIECPEANDLLYIEVATYYKFDKRAKKWVKRKKTTKPIIARMYSVSPKDVERFHLRLLLLHVRGAKDWKDLRTVDGTEYDTYKKAAIAMKLVDDDREWERCLAEAAAELMPKQMRLLFAYICVFNGPKDALSLWEQFKNDLSEDFVRRGYSQRSAERRALAEIYEILAQNRCKPEDFGLPPLPDLDEDEIVDDEEAGNYSNDDDPDPDKTYASLNADQKLIYDRILEAVQDENVRQRLFYMDGPGGTGKTFLYNAIIGKLRQLRIPTVAVAWTGIAATLLKRGRTSHNAFRFPVPVNETSTCNVKPASNDGRNLRDVRCIIWDEITVAPKHALQCLDNLLKDLTDKKCPFGGKVILLGGDFRQCLPVVKHAPPAVIVETSAKRSYLWPRFEKISLQKNMRVEPGEVEFSKFLLEVGSGKLITTRPDATDDQYVSLPSRDMLSQDLIADVFGDINKTDYTNKVILCAVNEDALAVNEKVLAKLDGEEKTYLSVDTIQKEDEGESVPIEFLNGLTPSGMPPHKLNLKVGAVVMLLRNMNISTGLCNGTRLKIKRMMENCLLLEVLTGSNKGDQVFLPRVPLNSDDSDMPFKFTRKQFPVRLSFAMTINKSQGQTFDYVGIDLRRPVFSHGQLYVALSRVRRADTVKIQVDNEDENPDPNRVVEIQNVVYRGVFDSN